MGTITSGPRKVKARSALGKYTGPIIEAAPTNFSVMDNWPACANVSGHIRDQVRARQAAGPRGAAGVGAAAATSPLVTRPITCPSAPSPVHVRPAERLRVVLGHVLHGVVQRPHVHHARLLVAAVAAGHGLLLLG